MRIPGVTARNGVPPPMPLIPIARRITHQPRHMRGDAGGLLAKLGLPAPVGQLTAEFLDQVASIGRAEFPVLMLGGDSDELRATARTLHKTSPRACHSYAEINCLAHRENDLALELFGSEAEATPESKHVRVGLFERCHQGTVFLSEIMGLTRRWQAGLVDLIDEQRLCRLGGRSWVRVDVRLIISTSIDVDGALAAGELRTDLYYRLQSLRLGWTLLKR